MKYYGYARVSTETQAEKGYGLDTQQGEIRKYAAAHSLPIENIFVDAGISGAIKDTDADEAITKREALMELLAVVDESDTVIVLNTSRLWRSDNTKVLIRRELMKKKVKLISIEQPQYDLYTVNPNDRLVAGMMELLDEWERLNIALKLARGRTVKAKGGDKPAGVCPLGYKYAPDKKSVIIDEDEAQIVKTIFTEAQKGSSLQRIADTLNEKGYRSRRGNAWSSGSIALIVHNEFYTGVLTHQGKPIKGNHPPIISKVQFGKAQAQITRRKRG